MSDLIGRSDIPVIHNASQGGAGAMAPDDGNSPSFGIVRNANRFWNISSNGASVADAVKASWTSTVITQEINVPTMCQMVFSLNERWTEKDYFKFKPGAKLEILGDEVAKRSLAPMYVSGMTLDASDGRLMLTVTAFDRMHFLRFGTATRGFENKTDAEIFGELLENSKAELTLAATVQEELPKDIYPYVVQDNETRYDFLTRRCHQANYECMVSAVMGVEKLVVRKSQQGGTVAMVGGKPLTLVYKKEIEAMNLDMRVPTLGELVMAYGYDVSGKVSGGPATTADAYVDSDLDRQMGTTTGFAAALQFPLSNMLLRRPDLMDRSSLDLIAQAEREHHQHAFIEGSATLRHVNLDAKAGVNLKIQGTGTDFDGQYYVVRSTHRADRNSDKTELMVKRSAM
jgi:phage protein D